MSEERPPIDPYPLSPYVAWAGNRNREPILQAFKTLFPKEGDVIRSPPGGTNRSRKRSSCFGLMA